MTSVRTQSIDQRPGAAGLLDRRRFSLQPMSVRGRMVAGFGVVGILLAVVMATAAWQARVHQSDLFELESHSQTASHLQGAEANASTAGLLLQRFVISGDEIYIEEIKESADAAQVSLNAALSQGDVTGLDAVYGTGTLLVQDSARVSALVQIGDVEQAAVLMESIVPVFREYRLKLQALAAQELAQVAALREQANATGQLTLIFLIVSGTIGLVFIVGGGLLLSSSILRPLNQLEDTARAVSGGDLSARAPTTGPGELAHLGLSMNDMMDHIERNARDLRKANLELRKSHSQLSDARSQAATDPLTGLGNHRVFHKRLGELVAGAGDSGSSVGLIMMDIDGFKDVNDRQGHQAGDELLRQVATTLGSLTDKQHCFRYGGDELAVLLPDAGRTQARSLAARFRQAISDIDIGDGLSITASLGVAAFPESAETAKALVYRADMAMYSAKATGKNRVTVWGSSLDEHLDGARPEVGHRGRDGTDIVASLMKALQAKDPITRDHVERCSWYSGELATELGLGEPEALTLRVASLLHDMGKLVTPDEILLKPGPLTEAEMQIMKRHPVDGANALASVPTVSEAIPLITHHHEHFDGSGYPHGLSGEDIPIGARILLVTDAFDAMTEDRPYCAAMPVEDAVAELKRSSGTQFDPDVVDAFLRVLARTGRCTPEAGKTQPVAST